MVGRGKIVAGVLQDWVSNITSNPSDRSGSGPFPNNVKTPDPFNNVTRPAPGPRSHQSPEINTVSSLQARPHLGRKRHLTLGSRGVTESGSHGGRQGGKQAGGRARRQAKREAGWEGGRQAGRQPGKLAGRQGGWDPGRQTGREGRGLGSI